MGGVESSGTAGVLEGGARLGPYEILSRLGAGGMGEVWKAFDARLNRHVALKVLRAEVAGDAERLARFEREAKAVAALNHPNILTIHDVGVEAGIPYVVTELLEGENLRDIATDRAPTQRQVLGWAVQAARGISAAHQKGIVHRDIKPENLFVTADGLLKVLDFGIAKQAGPTTSTETATASPMTGAGVILGTLAYLSPEQAEGLPVDARSDLFSFGLVLYELLAGTHPFLRETSAATVAAILRDTPPPLSSLDPSVPPALDGIVGRCLEKAREDRFQGAHDLALALEAVLAARAGSATLTEVEERSPYPGIGSFTEKDSGFFFGREEEVKALWDRIRARRVLAVIGPSGAGKTSFLRAGVVPSRPGGWGALVATPGVSPFRGLGQALAPELVTDAEALRQLVNVDDPETAYHLALRWRRRHTEAILVVDQFEELFTLNTVEVQAAFAVLLARLAGEAGVRVALSLRDDFLMRCHEHRPLAPMFEAVVPLGPLTPEAMARALVEPARRRGYAFEDERLVHEMVNAVEGERGALPLLAFAVARLWELRDRERKLLTRETYVEIGGVAGALARHAEATMDRVGAAREPVVRELFRNLVTAQATRAVADRDELLSAFPDREAAEDVLHTLVDARLLTSYELEKERGASSRCRIEIVHESLLKAWPRLVRWRTQDEEGALLRDQLRQAARLWVDKGRTADLLWTGTAFQEFELWRSRYPGALTAVEEEFGRAMRDRALRSRRMRKTAVVAALVILSAVVVAVGISRQQAVAAARRAEASKLLAMAQERLAQDPTEALVFLTASVELTDTTEARRLALRALWEAPPALELGVGKPVWTPRFSLDGKQIATGGYMSGDARVFAEDGGTPRALKGHWGNPLWVSDRLVLDEDAGGSGKDHRATVWSLPDLKMERTFDFEGTSSFTSTGSRLMVSTEVGGSNGQPPERLLRSWAPGDTGLTELGRVPAGGVRAWFPDGTGLAHARGSTLVVRSFPFSSGKSEIVFGEHPPNIARIAPVGPGVNKLVTVNAENEMRLWTFENGTRAVFEDLAAPTGVQNLMGGRWLFRKAEQGMQLWPKGWWTAARPLFLRRNASWWSMRSSISPGGDWFVATTESYSRLTFWPLRRSYPIVVDGFRNENKLMAFSPDGRWLATAWPNVSVQLWPLVPGSGSPRTLDVPGLKGAAAGTHEANGLAFDPGGRFLFCVGNTDVWVVPLDGRPPVKLEGFKKVPYMVAAAVSPSGRQVATAYMAGEGDRTIRVWDLETKSTRAFDIPLPAATASSPAAQPGISSLAFGDEATLYSSDFGGVRRWDLATGRSEVVIDVKREGAPVSMVIRPAHGVAVTGKGGVLTLHDLSRGTARELPEFGGAVVSASLDSAGRMLVTGDEEGIIRVGRLSGGEPHLLIGHKGAAETAMSPDGKWIASAGGDNTLRLWPVPELDKPPLHALPHDALVAKLKSLTNLRAVRDEKASSGWRIDLAPFPGWKNAPEW